ARMRTHIPPPSFRGVKRSGASLSSGRALRGPGGAPRNDEGEHHRERIATEGAIGENVHRDVASLHLPSSLSQPPDRHGTVVAPDGDLAERHRVAAIFPQRVAN